MVKAEVKLTSQCLYSLVLILKQHVSQSLQLTRHHQPQDAASVCQLPAVVCVQGKDTYLQCQYNTAAAAAAAVAAGGWCWPLALIDYNACVCVQINVFFFYRFAASVQCRRTFSLHSSSQGLPQPSRPCSQLACRSNAAQVFDVTTERCATLTFTSGQTV